LGESEESGHHVTFIRTLFGETDSENTMNGLGMQHQGLTTEEETLVISLPTKVSLRRAWVVIAGVTEFVQ
jgi:hypothetical protein